VAAGLVVRCVLAVVAAVALSACAGRDPLVSNASAVPSGDWRIERQVDRITGAPLSSAFVMTKNSSNSQVDFPQPAQLHLLCFKDQPIVRLVFEFKVGSNKNSVLGYRFDEKPGHEINDARFLQDFKTVVIEEKADVAQFVSELATSEVLYVRIRSLNSGRSTAEFHLKGAPAAIEAGYAGCPLSADKQPLVADVSRSSHNARVCPPPASPPRPQGSHWEALGEGTQVGPPGRKNAPAGQPAPWRGYAVALGPPPGGRQAA
jgi:hypothetical protein